MHLLIGQAEVKLMTNNVILPRDRPAPKMLDNLFANLIIFRGFGLAWLVGFGLVWLGPNGPGPNGPGARAGPLGPVGPVPMGQGPGPGPWAQWARAHVGP